ncbi:MAG: butyrate kinase [Clostridiales bacterium]|nr:butyrate kinase [Clostridiales bacterium]
MSAESKWVLAINPGSTSTKIALYENETERYKMSLDHQTEEIQKYKTVNEQYEFRKQEILNYLNEIGFDIKKLSAVSGRGGGLPSVKSGAYTVNDRMLKRLAERPQGEHASNLGAKLAFEIANPLGKPAFIYDSVAVNELDEIAKISGMPEIERNPLTHALNMRAQAIKYAKKVGKAHKDLKLIVAHLGGGITMSYHSGGKMVDIVKDDEGPFSAERTGGLPSAELVKYCYKSGLDFSGMDKKIKGKGGLVAYLGVNDARKVQDMIAAGDERAKLIYSAMGYQVAKGIGSLAAIAKGKVDCIILTGGNAYSKILVEQITDLVSWIAPVEIYGGENELESLAMGALRVINGEETPNEYDEETDKG